MKPFVGLSLACGLMGSVLAGCNEEPPISKAPRSLAAPAKAPAPQTAPARSEIGRIVFLDQKQACDCTRKRIDASWNALQAALKAAPGPDVLRIFHDVDEQAADEYKQLKPMMVAPGIYFLDKKGGLAEMLQGEVTEAQVTAVLRSAPASP